MCHAVPGGKLAAWAQARGLFRRQQVATAGPIPEELVGQTGYQKSLRSVTQRTAAMIARRAARLGVVLQQWRVGCVRLTRSQLKCVEDGPMKTSLRSASPGSIPSLSV
jgi:hypothetical protein